MSGLDAAVGAAERGLHVFALRQSAKTPAVRDWENVASADPEHVAAHWPVRSCGYGVACGPSGLVVIDADVPKPGDGAAPEPGMVDGNDALAVLAERAGARLPVETLTVRTGGAGWHWYFTAPTGLDVRNSARKLGWALDVRGQGGYVVGPGSSVAGRTYEVVHLAKPEPLPRWLCDLLRPVPAPSLPPALPVLETGDRQQRYALAVLRGELEAVLAAGEGSRNDALNAAAFACAQRAAVLGTDALTNALVRAGRAVGLPEREARATVASGLRAGSGAAA